MADVKHRQAGSHEDLRNVQETETVHHEPKSRKPKGGVRQLNLTSMLDVCFQLLIFFVLTANFAIDESVLPANLPQGTPPVPTESPPPEEPLKIVLRKVGTEGVSIWLERSESIADGDFDRLYEKLNGWRYDPQTNPNGQFESDNPIIIKPMTDVRWEHVVAAFHCAVRAKFENVSFAHGG